MLRNAKIQEVAANPRGRGATDKVEKFKWRSVGQKPLLMEVDKRALSVDDEYQRDESGARAQELASDWWWMACGALTVVRRKNGAMVVVDGQHRWLAACRRSDIDTLPCCVFDESDGGVADEAAAFVRANTNRKVVRSMQMFKARVVAGQEDAVLIAAMVKQAGREIGTSSSSATVACVGALLRCLRLDREAMASVWPLIVDVCHGKPITDVLVQGLHMLESKSGVSIASDPWLSRVRKIGADGLVRAATAFAQMSGKKGANGWARGMAMEINKGLRVNRLSED